MPTFGATSGATNGNANDATNALTATNEEVEAANGLTANNSEMDTEDRSADGDATDVLCSDRPTGEATTGESNEKSAVTQTPIALVRNVSKRIDATDDRTHVQMLIATHMEVMFQLSEATEEQSKRAQEQLFEHENTKRQYQMSQKENAELKRKLEDLQTQHEGKITALMQNSNSRWARLEKNFEDSLETKTHEIAELRGSIAELRSSITVTEQENNKLKEDLQKEKLMVTQLKDILADTREMIECAKED